MRLLVAVGDAALSRALEGTLGRAGHDAVAMEPALVNAFGAAVGHALQNAEEPFDAVIVDSPELLPRISAVRPHVRSLLLTTTTLRNARDKAHGLSHEGLSAGDADTSDADATGSPAQQIRPDAVLRMPFSDTELLAYVEMLAREGTGLGARSMIIRGDLTLDLANRKAYYASTHRPMPLSRLEYDVLETLVKADGRFVDIDTLRHSLGGYFAEEGLLRNALYTLDLKLRRAGLNLNRRDDSFRVL